MSARVRHGIRHRIQRGLALALCFLWPAVVASASETLTPVTHCCGGLSMPCCPPSGQPSAHCSADYCQPQSFQKSEPLQRSVPLARGDGSAVQANASDASSLPGLGTEPGFHPSVFLLKNDLRI